MCCNDKIFACLFDYEESKEEKEGRRRNKTQSNQPKRNSDVTHITYLVWPCFYFPWRFAVFFFFGQIFFQLSSLFFCCREISYRLDFSFRCEATLMSPRIAFFFFFVSVSCMHSGCWIHQIHAGGQTCYKTRQKFRRPKKSLAPPYLFWIFRLLNLALPSRVSLARDAWEWPTPPRGNWCQPPEVI